MTFPFFIGGIGTCVVNISDTRKMRVAVWHGKNIFCLLSSASAPKPQLVHPREEILFGIPLDLSDEFVLRRSGVSPPLVRVGVYAGLILIYVILIVLISATRT